MAEREKRMQKRKRDSLTKSDSAFSKQLFDFVRPSLTSQNRFSTK
jgi:hypothetical protein